MRCVFDSAGEQGGRVLLRCVACGREQSIPASMLGKSITATCATEPANVPAGVGTHLKRLLAWWGHATDDGRCGCEDHAFEMDVRGVDWCRENRGTILGWLKAEAERRGMAWDLLTAAAARTALEAAIIAAAVIA